MRFAFLGVFDCFRLRPSCSCITSSTTESNSTSHSPRDKRKGTAPLVTFSVPTTNSANSASRVQSFLKLDPSAPQNLTREQVQVVRTSQDRPGSDSQSVSLSNPIRLKALADLKRASIQLPTQWKNDPLRDLLLLPPVSLLSVPK